MLSHIDGAWAAGTFSSSLRPTCGRRGSPRRGKDVIGNRASEVEDLRGLVPAVGNFDLQLLEGLHSGREQTQRAIVVGFDAEVDPKVQGQILRQGAAGFFQEDPRIVNEPPPPQ